MKGDNKVDLHFHPPGNAKMNIPFKLRINLARVTTVEQLRKKVASRLSHFPEGIHLQYKNQPLTDKRTLQQLNIKGGERFFFIQFEPQYKRPKGVEPLIVGGLDLTDIKELSQFLVKKNYDFVPKNVGEDRNRSVSVGTGNANVAPSNGGSNRNGNGGRMQEGNSEEIDFKVKYATQLQTLKELGLEKTEQQLLLMLISDNGDVERVINKLF